MADDVEGLHMAFADILDSPNEDARSFFRTAGIEHVLQLPADRVWLAFLDHYTTGGIVDGARFAGDLARWPPIASRIVELQLEQRA